MCLIHSEDSRIYGIPGWSFMVHLISSESIESDFHGVPYLRLRVRSLSKHIHDLGSLQLATKSGMFTISHHHIPAPQRMPQPVKGHKMPDVHGFMWGRINQRFIFRPR